MLTTLATSLLPPRRKDNQEPRDLPRSSSHLSRGHQESPSLNTSRDHPKLRVNSHAMSSLDHSEEEALEVEIEAEEAKREAADLLDSTKSKENILMTDKEMMTENTEVAEAETEEAVFLVTTITTMIIEDQDLSLMVEEMMEICHTEAEVAQEVDPEVA